MNNEIGEIYNLDLMNLLIEETLAENLKGLYFENFEKNEILCQYGRCSECDFFETGCRIDDVVWLDRFIDRDL